tara:strand:- start:503 stop:841 length:339 start_codon:yes stop_codon:yes gene_type:complete
MAHYAFLDENNIVTEVIVGKDETDLSEDWEQFYGAIRNQVCKRTSYHGNMRKNYAGIGYIFDEARDAFIAPKPYPSWVLNEQSCQWESPTPMPVDDKRYTWDEATLAWVEMA